MRRRSRASSKLANARSRKAKTLKAARRSSSSASGQETEVAQFRRERDEALEQLSATSEVLKVISASAGALEPVFGALAQKYRANSIQWWILAANAKETLMALFVPLEVYPHGGLTQVNLDRVNYIRPESEGVSTIYFDNDKLVVAESMPRIIEIMGDAIQNR
jgi:hypothetical protein